MQPHWYTATVAILRSLTALTLLSLYLILSFSIVLDTYHNPRSPRCQVCIASTGTTLLEPNTQSSNTNQSLPSSQPLTASSVAQALW